MKPHNELKTFAHSQLYQATRDLVGKELPAKELKAILLQKFPDVNPGSISISSHAKGSEAIKGQCSCVYSGYAIVEPLGAGKYRVVEPGAPPVEAKPAEQPATPAKTEAPAPAQAAQAQAKPVAPAKPEAKKKAKGHK